jgi:hypothetical protein
MARKRMFKAEISRVGGLPMIWLPIWCKRVSSVRVTVEPPKRKEKR